MRHLRVLNFIAFLVGTSSTLAGTEAFTLATIDSQTAPIVAHVQNYPPHFDSDEQRATMEKQLHRLVNLLKQARDAYPKDRDIAKRYALVNALGHNLDFQGSAEAAIEAYEGLLQSNPDDGETQFRYGGFLAGTQLFEKSIPHLHRAIHLRQSDAHFTLAFVYVKSNQPKLALEEFRAFLSTNPENQTAQRMVQRLESGETKNLKVESPNAISISR